MQGTLLLEYDAVVVSNMRCGSQVKQTLRILLRCMLRNVWVTLFGRGVAMSLCQSNGSRASTPLFSLVSDKRFERSCCCSRRSTTSASEIASNGPSDEGMAASASNAASVFG